VAKSILTPTQQTALDWVAEQPNLTERFYLSGGTAIAEFYLHHRLSEDLDFFTPTEFVRDELQSFLGKLGKKIRARDFTVDQRLNRTIVLYQVKDGPDPLKVEFSWFVGEPIEPGMKYRGLRIDSELDLAVNKVFTVYQRPRARDFVDLYYLLPKYPIQRLMDLAKLKFDWHVDPLTLGARFNEPDLVDWPRMLTPLEPDEVRRFFVEQATLLESVVFDDDNGSHQ